MADVLAIAAVIGAFAVVLGCLAWLTRRQRGRRVGSSVAGPFEEIWHPAAHRARIDIEVQDERKVAAPSPGDPPGLARTSSAEMTPAHDDARSE